MSIVLPTANFRIGTGSFPPGGWTFAVLGPIPDGETEALERQQIGNPVFSKDYYNASFQSDTIYSFLASHPDWQSDAALVRGRFDAFGEFHALSDGETDTPSIPVDSSIIGLQDAEEGHIATVHIINNKRYLTTIARGDLIDNLLSIIAGSPLLQQKFCALKSACDPVDPDSVIDWIIEAQYEEAPETPNPTPTGIFQLIGPATVVEGASGQYTVQEKYTDNSWVNYTGSVTWSTVGAPSGITIPSGLLTVPNDTITADMTISVHAAVVGAVVEKSVTLTNVSSSIMGYHIAGPGSITEGTTSGNYTVIIDYADGSSLVYTGAGTYSLPGDTSGMTINGGTNATVNLTLPTNSITADRNVTLRFTLPNASTIEKTVSLTNVDPAVTITGYHINGPATITEGTTSANYTLMVEYSNGSTAAYTGGGSFGIPGDPKGTSVTNSSAGVATLTLPANSIAQNEVIMLRFTFVPSGIVGKEITLVNVTLVPPNPEDWPYWNDFSFNFFDENGSPSPGYTKVRGTWSWASGKLRQTGTTETNTTPMVYTQNDSANGLNAKRSLVRVKPTALVNNNSYLGVGIRMDSGGDYGYSVLIQSSTTVVLVHNGLGFGPAIPFTIQTGVNYWVLLDYQETGSSTATISAKIWTEGDNEPTAWMLEWTGQPRSSGYPCMFGGSSGATGDFEDFAYKITT